MYQLPSGFEDQLGAGVNATGKVLYILCPAFCSFDLQGQSDSCFAVLRGDHTTNELI